MRGYSCHDVMERGLYNGRRGYSGTNIIVKDGPSLEAYITAIERQMNYYYISSLCLLFSCKRRSYVTKWGPCLTADLDSSAAGV